MNPIRRLSRGALIVQDISPVNPSDGMKIVLQQDRYISMLTRSLSHLPARFQRHQRPWPSMLSCHQESTFLPNVWLGLLHLLGPVVRTSVSANLGLNFNPGFFFLLPKALFRIIFSILFRVSEYPIIKLKATKIKLNLLFKLSYLSSNFTLTLGYLNPASSNPALVYIGETGRTLRQRFGEHLRSIEKNLPGFPVAEHFDTAGHSINDALVPGIMLCGENAQRKRLEMRLIFQLGTSHLCGLNSDFRFLQAEHGAARAQQSFLSVFIFSFMRVSKPCNNSNVLVTSLMKGQA